MTDIMFTRLAELPKKHHFFLFGPRGSGKSTLINASYDSGRCLWLDLLDARYEERFALNPNELEAMVLALPDEIIYVVIDEIQKVPKLLDVVHRLIEMRGVNKYFVLTGSSARQLRRGGANLLAGRAFIYNLHPLSFLELENAFNLETALHWGMLPKIYSYEDNSEKRRYLQAYTHTYLKEEIWAEHIIKNLDPFRRFLEVAAQCNSKIINFSKISRDVGATDKTVKEYYSILEDTLLGFFLEPFQHSFRKRLSAKPKFYFFDTGIVRALAHYLNLSLNQKTSAYGEAFEHFIIIECKKLADYFELDYKFSYLKTAGDLEVDLVVERPGKKLLLIEIKSSQNVIASQVNFLENIAAEIGDCESICLSQDPLAKKFGKVTVFPWREGIIKYFTEQ